MSKKKGLSARHHAWIKVLMDKSIFAASQRTKKPIFRNQAMACQPRCSAVAGHAVQAMTCPPPAVCCLLSAVCCLLSAVCCLLSAVCCLLSAKFKLF
ncbi:MAG: hypothetical protein KJ614_07675 [Gammaproteobacteria bacterium]|uniref:hypothetical protein n=1 Tax=Rhodoferax sp. TaxID=50421 RepID=UPI0017D07289|nr:hypothetical protein [Rhodoferax sp.]MBU3898792.1 hypothetical protein [Gammaproteobacteria bacterium]MBA3057352.1 hypothetical protein [Rhodoferax sp.]MBU4019268.1 hypothetical protein [Gammaproteobacteria bacterium]MBU4081832.1 hypothetical protein [Gammaproteobacteria bacterium]MBU4111920.1 hypothetical protein [Gammaproteobacteria bacterium]